MMTRMKYLPFIVFFFALTGFAYGGRPHVSYSHGGGYHCGGYHRGGCYPGGYYHCRDSYQRCYPGPRFCGGYVAPCGIGLYLDNCCCGPDCEEVIVGYRTVCEYVPCYSWRNGRYCCWERYVCHRVPVTKLVYY